MAKSLDFSNKERKKPSFWLILTLAILLSVGVGLTLAFFFDGDYASQDVKMSGQVLIEAVGAGNVTIEDTHKSNLVINLDHDYPVLIPGMPITMPANCKVYQSTTMPLLRAKLDINLLNPLTPEDNPDEMHVVQDLYTQLYTEITSNKWHLHTDSYFYYVGNYSQNIQGGGYATC